MADGALRWKILTSKSDRLKRSPQNPRALMSKRASWVAFAERWSCSQLKGLQKWFERHILADFLQHTGGEIPKLIVSHLLGFLLHKIFAGVSILIA